MKEDFDLINEALNNIGIIRVSCDFYEEPKRKGSLFFVKSPATPDKTASLALYQDKNRFVDFANGWESGDIIGFVAYVTGSNQWESLKKLKDFYGLTGSKEMNKEELKRRIQLQKMEKRRQKEREETFRHALLDETDRLISIRNSASSAITQCEPLSDAWVYCVNELQRVEYMLDILCGSQNVYQIWPGRSEWILDCLEILKKRGLFIPTKSEMSKLHEKMNHEKKKYNEKRRKKEEDIEKMLNK